MKGLRTYESQRIENGSITTRTELITEEKPLRITINGEPFTVTMRTPDLDKELALGLLHNEDIIQNADQLQIINDIDGEIDTIDIRIDPQYLKSGYMNARNFLSVSSCGVCGKTELPKIDGQIIMENDLDVKMITTGFLHMRELQSNFERSGGCHAAAILNNEGKIIAFAEDIGRHNAVDKTIGSLLLTKQLSDSFIMLVSGRVSYEIIIKCFRSKTPILAAVSAPSSLAIDYAKELGIQLYGFCRENRMTRFA
ncbi:MAG: formate dehydrogenase accessory sulfurtransferase FdhD [Flavobacteriales bacterium]|nr:formate dehydrogenase accessory sulfurtransferase FdhD [Flavobacteriales bacterium]MCB9197255.1 formate dehydrogenase accessory sulfurtransferase FdhD [Flavobacteriales bacterium]